MGRAQDWLGAAERSERPVEGWWNWIDRVNPYECEHKRAEGLPRVSGPSRPEDCRCVRLLSGFTQGRGCLHLG